MGKTGRREGEIGPQNSLRTKYVVPVSKRKEIDGPDTVISTWGFLSELTRARESPGLSSRPWSGPEGRLEGGLCLMSPCHEVHRSHRLTSVPCHGPLEIAEGPRED